MASSCSRRCAAASGSSGDSMSDPRKPADESAASGERHGRDLQKVNEKLRELVASLRTERERLAAEGRTLGVGAPAAPAPSRTPVPTVAPAQHANDPVDLEKKRLAAELALAREAVAHTLYVAGREDPAPAGEDALTACIPLRVRARVSGAIAVFRLLGHKPVL